MKRSRRRRSRDGFAGHLRRALKSADRAHKPIAFIVAGHNGSGKSTLWNRRLANRLQIPLVNADRLTLSLLPPGPDRLPDWAQRLRDDDARWQLLAQQGVQLFTGLIMAQKMPFAFETVFSFWQKRRDGSYESKAEIIQQLQKAGYFVVLIFVGLVSPELSIARVHTRLQQGGHAVPIGKLRSRFPRTQMAIRHAAPLADRTLMFDNSGSPREAFRLVRAQQGSKVLYDCRFDAAATGLAQVARLWLNRGAPEITHAA